MTTLEQVFLSAATGIEAAIAAAAVSPQVVPVPIQPGTGQPSIYIDPRTYGAVGDGIHDDTQALQTALDVAGAANAPCVVVLTRGRFLCNSGPLRLHNDGVVLQGFGCMGEGPADNFSSCLVAGPNHTVSPLYQMDANDGGHQWYRGVGIKNVSFDVSGSPAFNSGTHPAPVLALRGISNCQGLFDGILVYGNIGTAIDIGINMVAGAICENLTFANFWCYAGFMPDGGYTKELPKAPAVAIHGADNIQFQGGFIGYAYGSWQNPLLPVQGGLLDVPAIQVSPAAAFGTSGSLNICNNGITFQDMAITNYVVDVRLSAVEYQSTLYGIAYFRFNRMLVENFNTIFQVNQEPTKLSASYWKTQVYMSQCQFGGLNAWFGKGACQFRGDHMLGGHLEFPFLAFEGDLQLGVNTVGVNYTIGPHPAKTGYFPPKDLGTNWGSFIRNDGRAGGISTGSLVVLGNSSVADVKPGTGNPGIQSMGDTAQLWASPRTMGPTYLSDPGRFGEETISWDPVDNAWYRYTCVQSGAAGAANWVRIRCEIWDHTKSKP